MIARAGQVQWGDVATWLASAGTLLAFAAAAFAIGLQRREFRLAERQNRQTQASGLSVGYADLGFTDSDGRCWVRRWTGSLIEVPLSPGAVILGGPQAFEVADYLDPLPRGITKDQALEDAVEKWARSTGLLDLRRARRNRRRGVVTQ